MYTVLVTFGTHDEKHYTLTWQKAKRMARMHSTLTIYGAIVYRPNGTELCRFYDGVER